jgi:hypothetical protein
MLNYKLLKEVTNSPTDGGISLHEANGSPVVPSGQLQVGIWLTTSQRAPCPQVPGHGSIQR